MISLRLVSNGLIFLDDIAVNIHLVTFSLLSIVSELSIGVKTKKFWSPSSSVNYTLSNKKLNPFSDICTTLFVRSVSFFSVSTCFVLFEVTFLFKRLSVSP